VYILDRTNGTPLIGIDEKPVPQTAQKYGQDPADPTR